MYYGHSDEFDYGEYGKTDDLDAFVNMVILLIQVYLLILAAFRDSYQQGDSCDSVEFAHRGFFGESGGLMLCSSGRNKYIGVDLVGCHIIIVTQTISSVVSA